MKALSLTQPWATLVAIGAKRIETRSWGTSYRGPLAIHAAKGFPAACRDVVYDPLFRAALRPYFAAVATSLCPLDKYLPRGCVLATGHLVAVRLIADSRHYVPGHGTQMLPPPDPELSFGDFSPGRYGWIFEDVKLLSVPIPAKGALGLWEWDASVASTNQAQQSQGSLGLELDAETGTSL